MILLLVHMLVNPHLELLKNKSKPPKKDARRGFRDRDEKRNV